MDDNRLIRIEDKLDAMGGHLSSIDVTLAKQSILLDQHIKRTNLLEAQVKPIQDRMHEIKGAVLFIKILAGAVALLEAIRHFMMK